jgi:hypothetical protein
VKHPIRSSNASVLRRGALAVAVGAVLFALSTAGWLVLNNLSSGAAGIRITLNWTPIVGFGMPFVALVFLILWLSDKVFSMQSRDNKQGLVIGPAGEDGQSSEDHGLEPSRRQSFKDCSGSRTIPKDVAVVVAALDKNVRRDIKETAASLDQYFASHSVK